VTSAVPGSRAQPFSRRGTHAPQPVGGRHRPFPLWLHLKQLESAFASGNGAAVERSRLTVAGAGHFLPEDRGTELGRIVVDFISATG